MRTEVRSTNQHNQAPDQAIPDTDGADRILHGTAGEIPIDSNIN